MKNAFSAKDREIVLAALSIAIEREAKIVEQCLRAPLYNVTQDSIRARDERLADLMRIRDGLRGKVLSIKRRPTVGGRSHQAGA